MIAGPAASASEKIMGAVGKAVIENVPGAFRGYRDPQRTPSKAELRVRAWQELLKEMKYAKVNHELVHIE